MAFGDIKKRLLVSSLSILVVFLLVYFSFYPIVQGLLFAVVLALSGIALYEYTNISSLKGIKLSYKTLCALAAVILLSFYGSLMFAWAKELPKTSLMFAVIVIFLTHFSKIEGSLASIGVHVLGLFYLIVPLGLVLKILYPQIHSDFVVQDGRIWLAYLIAVTKMTDIGAYFGGHLIGKKKLAPSLSPKKTVEGGIVGLVFAILTSIAFAFMSTKYQLQTFELSILTAIILGVILGVVSQCGDLAESLLKRDAGIKDSNKIPGIGGVLDLLDSLLFTIPVLYVYLYFL